MDVAWSVSSGKFRRPAFISLALGVALAVLTCSSTFAATTTADALQSGFQQHSEDAAANSFVFGRADRDNLPLAVQLSLYTPPVNEYRRFGEMDKSDRHLALAQVTIEAIGRSLDNRIGHAFLAVTEPLKGAGGEFGCKQRFSMKSYLLRCRVKF